MIRHATPADVTQRETPLPEQPGETHAKVALDPPAMPAAGHDPAIRPADSPAPGVGAKHPASMAQHVLPQIAEAVRTLGERPVELALSPAELGHVRMSLGHDPAGAMNIVILAERPETLDLIRRNIDMLAQDMRDIGYRDVNFSFGRGGEGSHGQRGPQNQNPGPTPEPARASTPPPVQPPPARASGGIDIRM